MDDLKIIFYLVVTLLWFFFNNYRKVQKQARERQKDQSEPDHKTAPEAAEFDWEQIFGTGRKSADASQRELESKQLEQEKPVARTPTPVRSRMRRFTDNDKIKEPAPTRKRGDFSTTQNTNFKKVLRKRVTKHARSKKIRSTNWRKAVVLSEVLHAPYV